MSDDTASDREESEGTKVLRDDNQVRQAQDGQAILVQIYPPGHNLGRRFPLKPRDHIVGRLEDVDVPVIADSVSRRHARLFVKESAWFLEDLGSTNGSMVNDRKVSMEPLRDGDLLRFGDTIFKFLSGDNIEAAYHEEIYRMSILDGLTAVHNKRYLREFLQRELARATRHKSPVALVMFDIDHFKQVNDTHGHLVGDATLKELCRRLKPRIRKEDLLARYGGEEFACVLPDTDLEGAVKFAEDLRVIAQKEIFDCDGVSVSITISLGIAVSAGELPTPDDMMAHADQKLYQAKREGRNRVAA